VALLLAVAVLLSPASSAVAEDAPTTTTLTPRSLPRTDLELEERDNGNGGAQAPWLIWSGVAAVVAIGVGGAILKRRMD